jgi:hypothetical protein
MRLILMGVDLFFTSPFGVEVGAKHHRIRYANSVGVRGPLASFSSIGPLTRPKRGDLSPQGEVALRALLFTEERR